MKSVVINGQKIKVRKERKEKRTVEFHVISTILWIWALSIVFVFAWGVLVSMTDGIYYSLNPQAIIPKVWRLQNYVDAITSLKIADTGFIGMTWNSIWYSFGFTTIRIGVTVISAYVVARYNFKLKKFIYGFIILQMMIPLYGQTTANYKLLANIGIVDSPLMLLAFGAGHGIYFLILYSFFVGLSQSYEEAGRIDGASEFTICFKLMLPMAVPIMVALYISTWTGAWNDLTTVLLYLPSYPNLSAGLYRYKVISVYTLDLPTYFAGLLVGSLPPAIIFTIFSDTIMKNMTIGGLKG